MDAKSLVVIAHEINRQICLLNGEAAPRYTEMPKEIIASMEEAICNLEEGRNLGDSHRAWVKAREEQGWTYGETKDMEKKTSPCLVPFEALGYEQQVKDCIFVGIKNALELLSNRGE